MAPILRRSRMTGRRSYLELRFAYEPTSYALQDSNLSCRTRLRADSENRFLVATAATAPRLDLARLGPKDQGPRRSSAIGIQSMEARRRDCRERHKGRTDDQ